MKQIAFVGAGFSCSVLARKLVENGNFNATIFESRDHIGGNCHTIRDQNIMIHQYGPHIFNTSNKEVWDYINSFGNFINFTNRVKAVTSKGIFSLPINLLTINQYFDTKFSPNEAFDFIKSLSKKIENVQNFEDQALNMLGEELYYNFFYGYTKKQWGVEPNQLPASILKRLPVRFNYNDNYYEQKYQGIPLEGYTEIINKILDHPKIKVNLKSSFDRKNKHEFDYVFYSGPIDKYFSYSEGDLGYRTLKFERFTFDGDFQGNPVINYCDEKVDFTRITEHKHFTPWESHKNSICFKEFSSLATRKDDPYYPLRLSKDLTILKNYMKLCEEEDNVSFIGRLGTYRYLDMHVVIEESLNLAEICLLNDIDKWPTFSKNPI